MSLSSALFFENVVIGSGPGGAITAFTLAESGENVLIIEEGKNLGIDSCPQFTIEEMITKYRGSGMTVALGKHKVSYVEAQTVGGGSEVNSGLYHRTPPDILEKWAKDYRLENATYEQLVPFFEYVEKEVNVSLSENVAQASYKLQQGAINLGWKSMEVPRWRRGERRQSMSETFIPKALRLGAQLIDGTKALKIVPTKAGGWRVKCKGSAGIVEYECKSLFVCAGAIQSPALLLRSGIKKNIGRNLQMHPSFKFVAQFSEHVNSKSMGVPVHQVKEFAPDVSFGCSISSLPYLALGLSGYPNEIMLLKENWKYMAVYYAMVSGKKSVGKVMNSPFGWDPFVFFDLNDEDLERLASGVVHLAENLFAAGARRLISSIGIFESVDDLKRDGVFAKIKSNGRLMTIHLFCTCPMGGDASVAAVDSYGKVYGYQNLFINDGSILCSSPGVNPQGTIMAFARRNTLKKVNNLS